MEDITGEESRHSNRVWKDFVIKNLNIIICTFKAIHY